MSRKKFDQNEFGYLLASIDFSAETLVLPSPCIGICRIDARTDYCVGCLRTIDQITTWGGASEDDKRIIWQTLAQRYAASLF